MTELKNIKVVKLKWLIKKFFEETYQKQTKMVIITIEKEIEIRVTVMKMMAFLLQVFHKLLILEKNTRA